MISKWFHHLPKDEQAEFKTRIVLAAPVLERLQELLNVKLVESTKENYKKTNYDSPSWAMMQADHIGYSRALNEILTFLNLEK